SLDRANELNRFFNRFRDPQLPPLLPPNPHHGHLQHSPINTTRPSVSSSQVKRQLERLCQNKAAGLNGISLRVDQLCGILQHLFNLSLSQRKVPVLWKTSCLVLVLKKSHPSTLNSYRPVTSHIMKVLERLMLAHLRPQMRPLWTTAVCLSPQGWR
ncbi:hypothetical protein LDENG_00182730, partial [Lucifuga dentata]